VVLIQLELYVKKNRESLYSPSIDVIFGKEADYNIKKIKCAEELQIGEIVLGIRNIVYNASEDEYKVEVYNTPYKSLGITDYFQLKESLLKEGFKRKTSDGIIEEWLIPKPEPEGLLNKIKCWFNGD
jgi:hypothetical protein